MSDLLDPVEPSSDPLHEAAVTHARMYAVVGLVASGWSFLELNVSAEICRLAGLTAPVGFCLTAQIQSLRNKLLALEALVHERGGSKETIKEIRCYINSMEKVTKIRNRIIHDMMVTDSRYPNRMEALRNYVDRKLVYQFESVTMRELIQAQKTNR